MKIMKNVIDFERLVREGLIKKRGHNLLSPSDFGLQRVLYNQHTNKHKEYKNESMDTCKRFDQI